MPKFTQQTWVKNVNKQRIVGGVVGVFVPTVNKNSVYWFIQTVVKVVFTHLTFPIQPVLFSTPKKPFLYLLNNLYTHNPQDLLLSPLKRI